MNRLFSYFLAFVLIIVVVFVYITFKFDFYSQYNNLPNYKHVYWRGSNSNFATTVRDSAGVMAPTTPTSTSINTSAFGTTNSISPTTTTTSAETILTTVLTATPLSAATPAIMPTASLASTINAPINNIAAHPSISTRAQFYVTASFDATCSAGGFSNRLFEIVSLYGIARTLGRIPFANLNTGCILNQTKDMATYFPQLVPAIELKRVSENMTTKIEFGNACCKYEDVGILFTYDTSHFIALSGDFLQSFKYFHEYRKDVLKLLTFTDQDIDMADKIAKEAFQNDTNHKICVHIRRGDFLESTYHQFSTESFTLASVFYVRKKLLMSGKNTTVALLGDDRPWAKELFSNFTWAHVPERAKRPTIDYALVARHCQTVILTASASSFGFWLAYLSSAETVYYNEKFATGTTLINQFAPDDVFLPEWIPLRLNDAELPFFPSSENIITEVPR